MPRGRPALRDEALPDGLDYLVPDPHAGPGETDVAAEILTSPAVAPFRLGEPGAPPLADLAAALTRLTGAGALSVRGAGAWLYGPGHDGFARKVLAHLCSCGLAAPGAGGSTEATAGGKAALAGCEAEMGRIIDEIDARIEAELDDNQDHAEAVEEDQDHALAVVAGDQQDQEDDVYPAGQDDLDDLEDQPGDDAGGWLASWRDRRDRRAARRADRETELAAKRERWTRAARTATQAAWTAELDARYRDGAGPQPDDGVVRVGRYQRASGRVGAHDRRRPRR